MGSWTCDACMVNNKASDSMCVACTAPCPVKKLSTTKSSASQNNDFLSKFAPPSGSWTCETCLVSNKAGDKKCIACQTPRPSVKPLVSSSRKTEEMSVDLLKKFAPPAGSWSCDSCFVSNRASDANCVACQSPKPGANLGGKLSAPSTITTDNDLAKKFAPAMGSWTCDMCMLSNQAELDKCNACEASKPGAKLASSSNQAPVIPSDSSLAKKFAPPSGSWECGSCMLSNKGECDKCVACETPRPGAKPSVFTLASGSAFSKSPFHFGAATSKDTKPLQFGTSSTNAEATVFKFGGSMESKEKASGDSGFKFVSTSGASTETKSSPFIFGAAAGNSTASESQTSKPAGSNVEEHNKGRIGKNLISSDIFS